MVNIDLLQAIQQDIEDIKGLVNYEEYGLSCDCIKKQSRGIIINLEEHLEVLIKSIK